MFPRAALILAVVLVTLLVTLFVAPRWFGPFRLWHAQMQAGAAYMKSLQESDMPTWIDRSTRLLAEYRRDVGPVGVYYGVTSGKPIPPELQRLKIIRIDIFEDRICYVWMGGMDHTYLEARRLPDGSFRLIAHYNDAQSEIIWPKRPNQAMERTATRFALTCCVAVAFSLRGTLAPGGRRSSCSR
jgi:hypothetical protein